MKNLCLTLAASLILTACGANSANQQVDREHLQREQEVQSLISNNNMLSNGSVYSIDRTGIYVDKTPIDSASIDNKLSLPRSFNNRVNINDQNPKTIGELSSFLTKVTGQKVVIQQDLLDDTTGTMGMLIGQGSSGGGGSTGGAATMGNAFEGTAVVNEVIYSGTIKGLFDHITSRMNVYWKYDNGNVEIYKYETKMFSLNALSGTSTLSASLNTSTSSTSSSSSDSSSSGDAQSGQQTQVNNTIAIWEEVGAAIQGVLSENEKLSLTPSAGKIVVMATPVHMRKVENIIKQYNDFYSKKVRLDVKVYEVITSAEDNYGIDWSAAWSNVADNLNISAISDAALSSAGNLLTGNGSIGANGGNFIVSGKRGKFGASGGIAQALSTAGKVSLLRNNNVVTLNNQSVPLNVAREVGYLQSTKVTNNSDGNPTTEMNPGIVTEGFSMSLTPLVNDKGEILLQYSVDTSNIEKIESFSSQGSQIQLPTRTVSNFMQKVAIRNGESMVLTAFQEAKADGSKAGVGSSRLWGLGGTMIAKNQLKTIVVVVTPYLMK